MVNPRVSGARGTSSALILEINKWKVRRPRVSYKTQSHSALWRGGPGLRGLPTVVKSQAKTNIWKSGEEGRLVTKAVNNSGGTKFGDRSNESAVTPGEIELLTEWALY